ncbi:YeiH family protein [Calidifontibacter terrae]
MSTAVCARPTRAVVHDVGSVLPGLLVAVFVACLAALLGSWLPLVGGPVFGIVLGIVFASTVPALRAPALAAGRTFAAQQVLQASIVVLGTGLSLHQVVQVGGSSLPVMVGTLAVALGGAALIGRALRVERDVRTLIGVGTGICGASAIAAATAVTRPKDADVGYAIGTIFVFNIAAVLSFPVLGHLFGMGGHAFGLWSGTAVNDTSSVVAAAYSFGDGAGPYAIVVKLTRSLMIIPVTVVLAWLTARRSGNTTAGVPWRRVIPGFLVGFLVAAALNSLGVVPAAWHPSLTAFGTFLITVALAGIGLSLRLGELRRAGVRPLLLGGILWVLVACSSLGLQALTGTW